MLFSWFERNYLIYLDLLIIGIELQLEEFLSLLILFFLCLGTNLVSSIEVVFMYVCMLSKGVFSVVFIRTIYLSVVCWLHSFVWRVNVGRGGRGYYRLIDIGWKQVLKLWLYTHYLWPANWIAVERKMRSFTVSTCRVTNRLKKNWSRNEPHLLTLFGLLELLVGSLVLHPTIMWYLRFGNSSPWKDSLMQMNGYCCRLITKVRSSVLQQDFFSGYKGNVA